MTPPRQDQHDTQHTSSPAGSAPNIDRLENLFANVRGGLDAANYVPEQEVISTNGNFSLAVSSPDTVTSTRSAPQSILDYMDQLSSRLKPLKLEDLVETCMNIYFHYHYPIIPFLDEDSVVNKIKLFLLECAADQASSHTSGQRLTSQSPAGQNDMWKFSTFTLMTALCAEMILISVDHSGFSNSLEIGRIFLDASRNALQVYRDAELENPSLDSITVRYFHSNCLYALRKRFSWYSLAEAIRIAQMMGLHQETSYHGLEEQEIQKRRLTFWTLYSGDKSAALLNGFPVLLDLPSFENEIGIDLPFEPIEVAVVSTPISPNVSHQSLICGFNLNSKMWRTGADLIFAAQKYGKALRASSSRLPSPHEQQEHIDSLYIRFMTSLDAMPDYLRNSAVSVQENPSPPITNFAVQYTNLVVTFHFLRMKILQALEENDFSTQSRSQQQFKRTEIARDMLRTIKPIPIRYLQLNGESCVEKFRRVGAVLLEILHTAENDAILARVRTDLPILIDILSQLNSQASENLRNEGFEPF